MTDAECHELHVYWLHYDYLIIVSSIQGYQGLDTASAYNNHCSRDNSKSLYQIVGDD